MAKTIVGLGDPKAVRAWSTALAVDVGRESYFSQKFMGEGVASQTPIQRLNHLENDAGDSISYDLVMQLRMQPIEGDRILEGNEEDLKFYTDAMYIDQARGGVNAGGRMTRQRQLHDLRSVAKSRETEWWARVFDELFFMYLSGARGVNADYTYPASYPGFANNPLTPPDTYHHLIESKKTKSTLTTSEVLSLATLDAAKARASVMGGGTTGIPAIEPCKIDGEEHYVVVMHPFQAYSLRTNAGTGQWLDIQKAATTAEGRKNQIFKGGLGMYNNIVLHEHKAAIRFNDYGSDANLEAARALFMGRQAAVVAFGSPGSGLRFDWHEETRDNGNQIVITTSSIFGVKKTSFKTDNYGSLDFGVMALDSYIADPSGASL